jgi:thiol-disulfide isomerase/thioredoxin
MDSYWLQVSFSKRAWIIILLVTLTVFQAESNSGQKGNSAVVVSGRILDAFGNAPGFCRIRLGMMISGGVSMSGIYGTALKSVVADPEGCFLLAVPQPGLYKICFTSPHHDELGVPLIVSSTDKAINIKVKLALSSADSLSELIVLGDWNNFSMIRSDTMTRELDGSFVLDRHINVDSATYAIVDASRGPLGTYLVGTTSLKAIEDEDENFKSFQIAPKGHLIVRYQNNSLNSAPGLEPSVQFDSLHSDLQQIFSISQSFLAKRIQLWSLSSSFRNKTGSLENFHYDAHQFQEFIASIAEDSSRNLVVRRFAAVCLVQPLLGWGETRYLSDKYGKEVLRLVPATSEMWSVGGSEAFEGVAQQSDQAIRERVLKEFANHNPETLIRAMALFRLTEKAQRIDKDDRKVSMLYNELSSKYGNLIEMKSWLSRIRLRGEEAVSAGDSIPHFAFVLDNGHTLSDKDLTGKYYLIDFWAVWCGACVAEMPLLHRLYSEYGGKRFTIVSIAFDSKSRVEKFRSLRWKMPWLNTIIENGYETKIAKDFGVVGLPLPILVGPSGHIVATEMDARGKNLESLLSKLIR